MFYLKSMLRIVVVYFVSLLSQLTQAFSGLVVSYFLLKWLDPVVVSFWFLLIGSIPFFSICESAIALVVTRSVIERRNKSMPTSEVMTPVFTLAAILVVLSVATLCAVFLGLLFWNPVKFDSIDVKSISLFFLLGLFFRQIANILNASLYSFGFLTSERLIRSLGPAAYMLLIGLLLPLGFGITSVFLAWVFHSMLMCFSSLLLLRNKKLLSGWKSFDINYARNIFPILLKQIFIAVPAVLIFNVALFYVAYNFDYMAVMQYSLLQQMMSGFFLLSGIWNNILVSAYSKMHFTGAHLKASSLLGSNVRLTLATLLAGVVVLLFFHQLIFQNWSAGKVNPSIEMIVIFMMLITAEVLQVTFTSAAMATGFLNYVKITWISAVMVLVLLVPISTSLGLIGVPSAILAAQIATCFWWNIRIAMNIYDISLAQLLSMLIIPIGGAIVLSLLIFSLQSFFPLLTATHYFYISMGLALLFVISTFFMSRPSNIITSLKAA